jgi:hypothetical protein
MAEGSWIRIKAVDAHLDARTVNPIITTALGKRAVSVTKMPELRKKIGEQLLLQVTEYVPEDTGKLRESGRVTTDGRLYWSAIGEDGENYAYEMYDPVKPYRWPRGKYNHPTTDGTYPRWMTKVAPNTGEWTAFINNITPIIKEEFAKYE